MTGPKLYVAPDGDNEPTLWRRTEDWRECIPVARRCDVSADAWSMLLDGAWLRNAGVNP